MSIRNKRESKKGSHTKENALFLKSSTPKSEKRKVHLIPESTTLRMETVKSYQTTTKYLLQKWKGYFNKLLNTIVSAIADDESIFLTAENPTVKDLANGIRALKR